MYKIYYLVCKIPISEDTIIVKQTHKSNAPPPYKHMLDARKTFQKENPNFEIIEMLNVDDYIIFQKDSEITPTVFITTYGTGYRKDK